MINANIGTTTSRKNVIINENTTLRAALEQNGVDYTTGQTSLDGATLQPGQLDKTFAQMGIDGTPGKDHCYLMVVVKADNAAKIKIAGGAVVVESAAKLDDLKKLAKYRPNALKLFEGGASFGTQATADGKAVVTMILPDGVADAKKWAEDTIGTAILSLNKVEAQFAAANTDIDAEIAAIRENIQVL